LAQTLRLTRSFDLQTAAAATAAMTGSFLCWQLAIPYASRVSAKNPTTNAFKPLEKQNFRPENFQ
jgi:hypothetical protein